ncbi:hypothetical protein ISCGN_008846 [Ixodes scapularis]
MFGRHYSTLSIVSNQAVHNQGAPLTNCWGFIDGTARAMCPLTWHQQKFFSGHKKYHCTKYQAVMYPNDITARLDGPYEGCRHDAATGKTPAEVFLSWSPRTRLSLLHPELSDRLAQEERQNAKRPGSRGREFKDGDRVRVKGTRPGDPAWLVGIVLRRFSGLTYVAVHNQGAPLTNCWGFIDGTARAMCPLTWHQQKFFSGHKKYHCTKYQAVMYPNDITARLDGPYEGCRHDAATGKTPAEVFLSWSPRTRLSLLHPELSDRLAQEERQNAKRPGSRGREFKDGDRVRVKGTRPGDPAWLVGIVLRRFSGLTYVVSVNNQERFVHADHLVQATFPFHEKTFVCRPVPFPRNLPAQPQLDSTPPAPERNILEPSSTGLEDQGRREPTAPPAEVPDSGLPEATQAGAQYLSEPCKNTASPEPVPLRRSTRTSRQLERWGYN